MAFTRRDFLKRAALLVASGLSTPAFLTRTAVALDPQAAAEQGFGVLDPTKASNILVVVQLSGGNDGLNTLVPFGDPAYAQLRPNLGLKPAEALPLTDGLGLHPNLARLKDLYDQGRVAIVQGVGYPNPDRSHFRSMDIWHSARPDTFERSGWLGRYLEACQCGQEGALPALSVGDQLNTLFWTQTILVPAVSNLGAFSFQTDTRYRNDRQFQLRTLQNIYAQTGTWSPYEALIRQGTLNALAASEQLHRAAEGYQTPVQYPANNPLANQLKMVAQVLAANLGTRLFSVQLGGFDTHGNQKNPHATLMKHLAEALDAFLQDLANLKQQDQVLIMTFSEFGRRARENGSGGTDHGTAEPLFVVGNRVQGGLYGEYPSLGDLDRNGDLKFKLDFRSVYAALLRDHLGADPSRVLAGSFEPVGLFPTPG
ncbi:MAG: DUF1501 domain-containing protein [Chloroflexi bacterium]|nr:DUF1501 domain-containing protein [Chloroflexota bacterium]